MHEQVYMTVFDKADCKWRLIETWLSIPIVRYPKPSSRKVWYRILSYFPHNQIITIITVTSNYVKFIKIYVLYLHDNRNKNYDVTLTLQASWNSGTRAKSQMFTYEIHS